MVKISYSGESKVPIIGYKQHNKAANNDLRVPLKFFDSYNPSCVSKRIILSRKFPDEDFQELRDFDDDCEGLERLVFGSRLNNGGISETFEDPDEFYRLHRGVPLPTDKEY